MNMWDWIDRLSRDKWHTTGASVFRSIVGMTLLYQLAVVWSQRELLFGLDGVYPYEAFADGFGTAHYSLLAVSDAAWFPTLFLASSLGLVALWSVGWGGRLATAGVWLAVHSLHTRCGGLWDGGDNVIEIVLIYAVFMDLSGPGARKGEEGHPAVALHNIALIACILQVCLLYFIAGAAKLPGRYWQNGTAFYYVLNSKEFGVTPFGWLIWEHPLILGGCTWGPVLLQLAFPWIYAFGNASAKRILVVTAMSFHFGIFLLMGLTTFAWMMIGVEMLLLSNADFDWFAARFAALRARLRKRSGTDMQGAP